MNQKSTNPDSVDKESVEPDWVPDVVDDNPNPTDDTVETEALAADEPGLSDSEGKKSEPEAIADPRLSIGEKARSARLSEMDGDFTSGNDPVVQGGQWAKPDSDDGDEEEESLDDPAAQDGAESGDAAKAGEPQKIEVMVNGRTVLLTHEELIAEASRNIAAGDRLDQARDLTKELATLRNRTMESQHGQDQQDSDAGDSAAEESQLDDDTLLDLIDKIQTGDPEEAAAAMRQALSTQRQQPQDISADVMNAVNTALAEREVTRQQNALLDDYAAKNPDIVADPDINQIVVGRTVNALVDDLIAIGCPAEEVRALAANDPKRLGETHRHWRNNGYGERMRDPAAVLGEVTTSVRQRFKMQAPAANSQESAPQQQIPNRSQRKADLPKQPRHASMSAQTQAAEQSAARTKPSDVVANIKRGRGQ